MGWCVRGRCEGGVVYGMDVYQRKMCGRVVKRGRCDGVVCGKV